MTEGANKSVLAKLPRGRIYWKQSFALTEFADNPGRWQLAFRGWYRARDADQDGSDRLRERIRATFQNGFFDNLSPQAMLVPACLICGKGLSDPASMARWIGPECAATSSIRIFRKQL